MPNWYRELFICPLCGKRHGISLIKRHSSNRKQDDKGRWILQPFICKSCGGRLKCSSESLDFKKELMAILWLIPITLQILVFVKYDLYALVMNFLISDSPAFVMVCPFYIALAVWIISEMICEPMVPFEGQPDGQKKKRTRNRTVSQMLKNETTYPDGIKGMWLKYKWLWLALIWMIWMYILGMPFSTFKGIIGNLPSAIGRSWWLY